MTFKTRGIIIGRRVFGEADRILTILTPGKGKIEAIAKGVRRPESKLGGNLELFYVVDFILAEGKTWYIVTGAELVSYFPSLYGDVLLTQTAGNLGKIIKQSLGEDQSYPKLYARLVEVLEYIHLRPQLLSRYMEWVLLDELGYWPELKVCTNCSNPIDQEKILLSVAEGGLVCGSCNKNSAVISANLVKLIRLFKNIGPDKLVKISVDEPLEIELEKVTRMFIEYHLEHSLQKNSKS